MSFRNIFQRYIDDPETCQELLLYDDDNVLIIKDAFPKALRHYLIIPKSRDKTRIHPLRVFQDDPKFYTMVQKYVQKTKKLIVEDLLESCLLRFDKGDSLARQEFENRFVKAGVHSLPSLNNLHIHVITQDFYSPRLKNKKHYNSFTTEFFVKFESLKPVEIEWGSQYLRENDTSSTENSDDEESGPTVEPSFRNIDSDKLRDIISKQPMRCTYCASSFGNKFAQLKVHLQQEFVKHFAVRSLSDSET